MRYGGTGVEAVEPTTPTPISPVTGPVEPTVEPQPVASPATATFTIYPEQELTIMDTDVLLVSSEMSEYTELREECKRTEHLTSTHYTPTSDRLLMDKIAQEREYVNDSNREAKLEWRLRGQEYGSFYLYVQDYLQEVLSTEEETFEAGTQTEI